jgi:signal transduction histidine kinase
LGLALVHHAMQQHGGEVRLASEQGRYFQVELLFPRLEGPP